MNSPNIAERQNTVGLQQPLKGDGIHGSSHLADQYLDNAVMSNITNLDPENECKSGDFERSIMKSPRINDSKVSGSLLGLNPFSEAGDFTPSGLDHTLLNRELQGNLGYFPPASETSQAKHGQYNGFPSLDDQPYAQQYQEGIVVAPPPTHLTSYAAINTTTSLRPQHFRRLSNLRNEYLPTTEAEASMAGPNPQQVYTSSPSRYTLRPQQGSQSGPGSTQVLQPFQESNMRSPLQHLPGYNSVNQLLQHQQMTYPDPQQYSQHPLSYSSYAGLSYQPMSQHSSATPRHRELAMRPPSTPPNLYAPLVGSSESNLNFGDSSPDFIKEESSSAGSPSLPARRVIRKVRTRKATKSLNVVDVDNVPDLKSDGEYIEELVDAMTDMSQAEDNVGMMATWSKILVKKADKIRPLCVEMLGLLKRAENEQLGDKTSVNPYPDFEHRFREFCDAARTQKTIGKHLMEAPYSHTVANDPTYAAARVRNNRRVNGQKRKAITLGRRAMGLAKGTGKGHRLRKLDGSSVEDVEDSLGDRAENLAEDSGTSEDDETFRMENASNSPVVKSEPPSVRKSARNSTRKTYANEVDDSPVAKKKKRRSRSMYQNTEEGQMVTMSQDMNNNQMIDMPRPVSRAHNNHVPNSSPSYLLALGSSPKQRLEQAHFHHNSHVFGYHPYGPTATSPPPLQLDHHGGFYSQNGLPFNQLSQQYTGYSSGIDQEFLGHANSEYNATDISLGVEHQNLHHSEAR